MEALGRLFDIGVAFTPVDLNTNNGATGKRISMKNASGITFVYFAGVAASGTDDTVIDIQQHQAYTGGSPADLDSSGVSGTTGVTRYHYKREALLDNDESWVLVTQAAASEVTLAGATYASLEHLVVIEVDAAQMAPGYTHLSMDVTLTTSGARLGVGLYLLHGLAHPRSPANLGNLLRPGVANA
ncbi:MAG: hypothetical protein PHQ28_10075 [Mycobacterium sp.]|nr:hypothetical protein [Mycobacterium sp.]